MMTLQADNDKELRQYLLGDLTEEARRRVEQRLMTEPDFLEELLAGEEELIDEYVGDELSGDEQQKFEQHFLCTAERRQQLSFARALRHYVSESADSEAEAVAEQEKMHHTSTPPTSPSPTPATTPAATPAMTPAPGPKPTLAERVRAFFGGGGFAPRAAVAFAALAVVAVALLTIPQLRSPNSPPRTSPNTFATITLPAGAGTRGAQETATKKVPLPLKEDALRVVLTLPEGAPASARYSVELENARHEVERLEPSAQDAHTVSVDIPAARLSRGQYALRLFATAPDSTEQRVQGGNYLFTAE
jgi:anti-sigma factor RsiW